MFFVYVLENSNAKLYVGFSNDLKRRLQEHGHGSTKTTSSEDWQLIYYEACLSKTDALRREGYLKTTQGKRMLKRRLKDYRYNKAN